MAIALDTSAVSTDQTTSPITWNHTCTGSNLMLVVGIALIDTGTPSADAVTYNGVSMTKARSDIVTSGGTLHQETSVWLLHNPATGSNSISVTATLGASGHGAGASASYTGVNQSSTADASGGTSGTTSGVKSFTVTTVADNCWIFAVGLSEAALSPTITATQTSRQSRTMASADASIMRIEDTNAAQTPAGAKNMGFTVGGTSFFGYTMTGASFAPATGGAATTKKLAALGVG